MLKSEPVKNTCPDIDRMIDGITAIVKAMDLCDSTDTKAELLTSIQYWSSELDGYAVGRQCDLEDLRDANAKLREWGNEMYNYAESLEAKHKQLAQRYDDLEEALLDAIGE